MKNHILLSDILILLKLFTPKNSTLFIFDPMGRIIFNVDFPLRKVVDDPFKILLNFADKNSSYRENQLNEFDLVFNFYNLSISKESERTKTVKTLVRLGFSSMVRSSSLSIYHPVKLVIDKLVSQVPYDEYSIFMDTIGINRTMRLKLKNYDKDYFRKTQVNMSHNKNRLVQMKVC
ncbi:MAG: hypothetical protein JKX68_00590 [Flavobacteriales bacterium]|nr:hypothetical protein [Flavobacteriales bacterium]